MWELDYKESWAPKNWCFWTVVLEKTLERPLDCKEIQLIHPKGNQSWVFIGRTDVEPEIPIFWPPDAKSWLTGKWKSPWCWERLRAGGEGDDRGWDDWKPSLTQWTWVWVNSGGCLLLIKCLLITGLSIIMCLLIRASPVAQTIKNLLAVCETQVQSLGWEDPWRREWQL